MDCCLKTLISFFVLLSAQWSFCFGAGTVVVNGKIIKVEVAQKRADLEKGLMHRESLAKDSGMLFVYKKEKSLTFWMKNTLIPLSIAFIDKNKKIVDIQHMDPPSVMVKNDGQLKRYTSKRPSLYALEMTKGWFKKNKVAVGDRVKINIAVP